MRPPTNEFSDLNRAVPGPRGSTYAIVCHVGYGVRGWALLWGRGRETREPVVTVLADGRQVHQEPTADRADAERIIRRLEAEIRAGSL
ncbi:hypothetical protein G7072_10615 [Nocardioides sp. HDW12B]|uniref:hypothetical protein n=1 Tax=Nocardioides sp. HDW12B TaxID=2714939 RepID=UPI00140E096A|nr:hypothetical protein [Nocardioides sp. HDW12B]QIK66731.1 hypothetical protein G7072_10615 [Nocardioides sp. HDW12B]